MVEHMFFVENEHVRMEESPFPKEIIISIDWGGNKLKRGGFPQNVTQKSIPESVPFH